MFIYNGRMLQSLYKTRSGTLFGKKTFHILTQIRIRFSAEFVHRKNGCDENLYLGVGFSFW